MWVDISRTDEDVRCDLNASRVPKNGVSKCDVNEILNEYNAR
jgi:hypothetical protein